MNFIFHAIPSLLYVSLPRGAILGQSLCGPYFARFAMDDIISLCNEAKFYPQNFAHSNLLKHVLDTYWAQLTENQGRLFIPTEKGAALDFYDLEDGASRTLN